MRPDLGVELAGISLKNPVMVCSGTFGSGREFAEFLPLEELGAIVTKSVTEEPRAGNPPPRIWETPAGMLNSIGLENKGVESFIKEDLPYLASIPLPVFASVAGSSVQEYARVASRIAATGLAAAVELNASCPNVRRGGIEFGMEAAAA